MTWFLLFLAVSTAFMSFSGYWALVYLMQLPVLSGAVRQAEIVRCLRACRWCCLSSLPMVWTFLQGAV
ncbi:hypothetical protein J7444_08030 [Labrenzia sp. R4_1]|uniref:hypothetical protein n=1 Tax=Labrenzia sp. R4_1 TaxID=2821106 RepID=UPI001AD9DACC|nr:hypothetical protein [Labrenzia sp. R4_1]MBO9424665.1 hypothetical protein [Labrenzia sp. R4_1]